MEFLDLSGENSAINVYGPAKMQKNHFESQNYMKHIIKNPDGQSSKAIKRCCGVSYVNKSESKQVNVRQNGYEKLGHVSYQGSYSLNPLREHTKEYKKIMQFYKSIFENPNYQGVFIACVFEQEKECLMKEYLLKPYRRLSILEANSGEIFLL